ncbi:MAG: peptidase M14, partial [Gemmatimonadetes bacterium]|nr:peptidase M14 [Gemmatimonadota bacterium]
MRISTFSIGAAAFTALLTLALQTPLAGQSVPSPTDHFGFDVGTPGRLATWDQLSGYYDALARASDRVVVDTLGLTTKGRPFVMLTITSPENHARLDELQQVQRRLADPRTVSGQAELESLLDQGRAVVMITHNIHSTEVGTGQSAARVAHTLASSDDPKVQEILDNLILLQIPSLNPDGTQWVNEFYNEYHGTEFEGAAPPWLYQFYVGHDNNRDWFTFYQAETQHTVRAQNDWHPQIVHDVHQMGGSGARIFFPPYIDPIEPNVDPGLTTAVNQLGAYMAAELTSQGKPGVVINAIYDGFHPGRAYMHYHGGARILSETASARLATTVDVPPERVQG